MSFVSDLFSTDSSVKMPSASDYMPLANQANQLNNPNMKTPFGRYKWTGKKPMSFNQWVDKRGHNPDDFSGDRLKGFYNDYRQNVKSKRTRDFKFSKQGQGMFDKVFADDGYDQYSNDYMDRYNQLLEPGRADQQDQFEQSMFNRGLPEGDEIYGDKYRVMVGDPNARQDLMAAQQAMGLADQQRMNDYAMLMGAMTGSQIPTTPTNVMGAANMALNTDMSNQQQDQMGMNNMWNTIGSLGGGYMMGSRKLPWED